METPWGEIPVSDAHVHFFSPGFFAALAKQKQAPVDSLGPLLSWTIPDSDASLADRWVAELDRHSVDKAALIASVPGDHTSVTAAVRRHPSRFRGYMMVDPADPATLAHVETALTTGFMRGICLFPAMHRYSMHDERVAPLIELAGRAGAVVFVHCGVLSVGVRKKLGLPSLFDMRYSNPLDLHAIAMRNPRTRFIVPHFGAGYFREALMLCDLCPNVWLDTSSSNQWMRYEERRDLHAVFRTALDVVGEKRLVFGTDSSFFPRGWNREVFEAQAKALYEIGVKEDAAKALFHDNFDLLFP